MISSKTAKIFPIVGPYVFPVLFNDYMFIPKRFEKMKFEKPNVMILSQVTYLPRKDWPSFC